MPFPDQIYALIRTFGFLRANPVAGANNPGIVFSGDTPTAVQGPNGGQTAWPSGGAGTSRQFRGFVASQAAMLALTPVNIGDWVERTDLSNQVFELTALPITTFANWVSYPIGQRVYRGAVASQAAMLALATVNVGDWVERTDLNNQIFELTTAGQSTLANWTAYPLGAGVSTYAGLSDAATANLPALNTPLAKQLGIALVGMGALAIDITNVSNTKTLTGSSTLSFSAAPSVAGTAFGLIATMTGAGTITLPQVFDDKTQALLTSFYLPIGEWALSFLYDGSRTVMYGNPGPINNLAGTVAPTVANDASQGYGAGSFWLIPTTKAIYFCYSAGAGAAVWALAGASPIPDIALGDSFAHTPSGGNSSGWASYGSFAAPLVNGTNVPRNTPFSATNPYSIRTGVTGGAGAPGSVCGIIAPTRLIVVPAPSATSDTIRFRVVGAPGDTNAGNFALGASANNNGLWTSSGVAFSTAFNSLYLGSDIGDTQLSIFCNNAAGAAFKLAINGGVGFPANTALVDMYDAYFELRGGATRTAFYRVTNKITGIVASGVLTDGVGGVKLPVAGTVIYPAIVRASPNAGTPTAVIDVVGLYGGFMAAAGGY